MARNWNFYSVESPTDSGRWQVIAEKFEDLEMVDMELREFGLTQDEANAAAIALNRMAIKCGDHIALVPQEANDEVQAA